MATKEDYPLAQKAWCAECGSAPGRSCVTRQGHGQQKSFPHAARLSRAESLVAGRLQPRLRPGEQENVPPENRDTQLPLIGHGEETRG